MRTLTAPARQSLVLTCSADKKATPWKRSSWTAIQGTTTRSPSCSRPAIRTSTCSASRRCRATTMSRTPRATRWPCAPPMASRCRSRRGRPAPIISDQVLAIEIHGETGLDGPVLPPASFDLDKRHAVDFIIDTVMAHEPKTVTLVPVGPYTNIALAARKEPRIVERVKRRRLHGWSLYARQHHARGRVQRLCRRGGRRCRVPRQLGRHHGGARPHPSGTGHPGTTGQGARRRRSDQPSSSSTSGSSLRRRMGASCRSSILPSMTHAASRP